MVANPNNPNRPPLRPSDRAHNNGIAATNPNPTRPKSKPVTSRYLLSPATSSSSSLSSTSSSSLSSSSLSTPRRCPSPVVSRTPAPSTKSRSLSADRRRSSPLRRDDLSTPATKLTATRSLSVSFQGESFSLPVRKATVTTPSTVRRRPGTPAAARPDQQRWPARIRQLNPNSVPVSSPNFVTNSLLKSFDSSVDDNVVIVGSKEMFNSKIELDGKKLGINSNETDSDSVSSDSSSSSRKFWHANLPKCPSKMAIPPKFGQPKRFPVEAPSPRANSSPMRGLVRPSSPMRGFNNNNNSSSNNNNNNNNNSNSSSIRASSPNRVKNGVVDYNNNNSNNNRGMASPGRVRVSISGGYSETPSVLSYVVDVKRGKVGENQINDAHCLRLLYNRHLQWRFVNARKEAVLFSQRRTVQTNLCNAWKTISNLRESVARKTHRLHLMKQKLKLADILKEQITFLEDWASLDKGHCMSLLGSIEALKGSTLRLPVVDGAITDLQSIKDAIGSAVDVMQSMGSSICSLLSKVEEMNFLASELTKEVSKEQALLEQCKVYFTKLAVQQVEYCSVRTHILQDNRTLPLLH